MSYGRRPAFLAALLAATSVISSGSALAQTAAGSAPAGSANVPPDAAPAPDGPRTAAVASPPKDSGLGEIVVTATRRSENLQDVPLSVSAVGGAQLATRGISQTADLVRTVPSLNISSQYGDTQPNFSLRGVGVANEFNTNTASPIGVYVDEVYQAYRIAHGLQLFDLDRIEVLRGPQGTLFGRNTTGGAINIFTKQPSLSGSSGYLQVGYGNYARKKLEGAVEVTPVSDKVGLRIAATFAKGDGFFKEVSPQTSFNHVRRYSSSDNVGVRATLLLKPSEDLTVAIKGYYSRDNPIGAPLIAQGLIGGVGGTDFFGYSRKARGLSKTEFELDSLDRFYVRTIGGSANIKYELGPVTLTSVTGYSNTRFNFRLDNDGTNNSLFDARYTSRLTDFSQDFRANYEGERFHGVVGVYYGKDTSDAVNNILVYNIFPDATSAATFNPGGGINPALPPTSLNAQYGYFQRRQSIAVYGEGTYSITKQLELTVGARYSHDKIQFLKAFSNFVQDVPGPILFPVYSNVNLTGKKGNFSGRVIANYKWSDAVRTYVSFSRGYRSGTYNGFAYSDASQIYFVPPERLDSIEGGFKTRFFANRLQINGAVFHYDYKNQQVNEVIGAVGFLRSLNAQITGLELEVLTRPVSALTLRGSFGFLDSSYKKGQVLSGNDVGGNTLPYASRYTANLGGDLTLAKSDAGSLILNGEVQYVSKFFFDPFAARQPGHNGLLLQPGARDTLIQKGYALVNARASFVAKQYTVSVFGKNLFDKRYAIFGADTTDAFGSTLNAPGAPRTYGVEVTLRF